MKRIALLALTLVLVAGVSAVFAYGLANSVLLTNGDANTCTLDVGDGILPGTQNHILLNVGSNQATMSVGGVIYAQYTENHTYENIGDGTSYGLPVTTAYSFPANTVLTVNITTYNEFNLGGGVSFSSTMTYDCTTGAAISIVNVAGGGSEAACPYPLPAGSVVYSIPAGAPAFFAPDASSQTTFAIPAGTWYISEFSSDFAKVWVACQASPVWVPANAVAQ